MGLGFACVLLVSVVHGYLPAQVSSEGERVSAVTGEWAERSLCLRKDE